MAFSGLLWLNNFVGYTAKGAFLVNAHNDNQEEVLAKTIAAFGNTEVFMKRTLGSTRLMESTVGELEADTQVRALKNVSFSGGKKGGLVVVTAEHTDKDIALTLCTESTETLLRMGRQYIGDEKEYTSTVIDEAIVTKGLINPWLYAASSVITALALFFIILLLDPVIQALLKQFRRLAPKRKEERESGAEESLEALDQRFVPQKLDPAFLYQGGEIPAEPKFPQPKASEVVNSEVYGKNPLQSVSVSMEDLPFTFESPVETKTEELVKESDTEILPADREPSVLEYKRRLNELLAQK